MNIHDFRKLVDDIDDSLDGDRDKDVTVKIFDDSNKIYLSTPSTKVKGIISGFDWDNWQIIIETEDRLCKK